MDLCLLRVKALLGGGRYPSFASVGAQVCLGLGNCVKRRGSAQDTVFFLFLPGLCFRRRQERQRGGVYCPPLTESKRASFATGSGFVALVTPLVIEPNCG